MSTPVSIQGTHGSAPARFSKERLATTSLQTGSGGKRDFECFCTVSVQKHSLKYSRPKNGAGRVGLMINQSDIYTSFSGAQMCFNDALSSRRPFSQAV